MEMLGAAVTVGELLDPPLDPPLEPEPELEPEPVAAGK